MHPRTTVLKTHITLDYEIKDIYLTASERTDEQRLTVLLQLCT
jgi:hypothetical protein